MKKVRSPVVPQNCGFDKVSSFVVALVKPYAGHLLVNLGFGIFRFPDNIFRYLFFLQHIVENFGGDISRNK